MLPPNTIERMRDMHTAPRLSRRELDALPTGAVALVVDGAARQVDARQMWRPPGQTGPLDSLTPTEDQAAGIAIFAQY